MKNNAYPNIKESEDQELNLKQIFEQYAFYWKWFVISVFACLFIAFVFLGYGEKIYYTSAKILLQYERQASGDMAGLAELATITGMGGSSAAFVNDLKEVLRSRRLMRKVVETNRLYLSHYVKGSIKSSEVLEKDAPLKVLLLEPNHARLDSVAYTFTVSKKADTYKIKDELEGTRAYTLGSKMETPIGPISLVPQENNSGWEGELEVNYLPADITVDILRNTVQITPNKETASFLVNFSMDYPLIAKSELILNSLIDQYNQDVTYDKAQVTRATSKFITSR